MAVSKVILNGTTLIDVTDDTVASNNLLSGEQATGADGQKVQGAYVPETYTSQAKTGIVPTEFSQTITPDTGYDGLSSVQINGISSTYVGSEIDRRDETDLTASGATVSVPAGYYAEAESKSIASGSAATPATTVTANPTISVNSSGLITATASATESVTPSVTAGYVSSGTAGNITVSGSATQQLSTQAATTITPTESEQTAVAEGKYTTGIVKVGAISSTYVGSEIERRDETDLTASGATVSVPAGYYSEAESKSVSTATQGTPSVSVNSSTGLVTATATQTAGYVAAGTKSGTLQLTTQAGSTIVPTESEQTAVAAGKYTLGTIKVGAVSSTYVGSEVERRDETDLTASGQTVTVPAGYYAENASKSVATGTAGTPSATKSTVSNHSVSVTPTVTNTTGYITGSTKTGTAITVTASELVSGSQTVTQNGTVDATNLAEVVVDVPGGVTVSPLSVTDNGTYTAPSGTAYSPVMVNVSGGGGGPSTDAQVIFYDYDGTVVESYTAAEFGELTALPANPSHTGLVAQGWNWTLTQIQDYLADYPDGDVNVGQMYITESGNTEIDIELKEDALNPYLVIAPNGTVIVDWGDGSVTDTLIGTSLTAKKIVGHIYPSAGDYTISLSVQSGSFTFYQNSNSNAGVLNLSETGDNRSRVYADDIVAVRLGNGVTSIGNNAFNNCHALTSLTIPSGVTRIGTYAFQNCYALTSLTIPSGVTSIVSSTFPYCHALTSLTIPSSVTSIGANAFQSCYALTSLTIPSSVTSIGNNAFQSCYALTSLTIPSSVTSIGPNAFQSCYALTSLTIPSGVTSIGNYAFQSCYALTSLTIPSGVTSIGASAFQNCYSVTEYHFQSTTPPTLGTSNFSSINPLCKIYVPSGYLEAYKTATNWSTYASYMEEEPA